MSTRALVFGILASFALLTMPSAWAAEHFHPKGKPPSKHTIAVLEQARTTLPFSDTRDFDEEKKGFIAAPKSKKIMGNAGNVAWDMERYQFFLQGKDFASIHPSLQRQGTLNMNFGLYEVMDGIYQVRGFDLANIEGFLADDPDLSITINRSDLEQTMTGVKKLADQIADGTAKVEGDVEILEQLASTLVVFDPRFEIMPGTKGPATPEDLSDYEYGPLDLRGE